MLKNILFISGRPGLYKLVSAGNRSLIVETVDAQKKRVQVYAHEQATSLGDIAMFTNTDEVPLSNVFEAMKTKENGAVVSFDYKKASSEELRSYLEEVLPDFDRDRVHISDIKKLIAWYNLLIANGFTEFVSAKEEATEE